MLYGTVLHYNSYQETFSCKQPGNTTRQTALFYLQHGKSYYEDYLEIAKSLEHIHFKG